MMHLPRLPSPLGRSSSRPCINPSESARGPFTRQPQSLQDHQDSCHSSFWWRTSGAWAGGLYANTVMTSAAGFSRFKYYTQSLVAHNITAFARCLSMYTRIGRVCFISNVLIMMQKVGRDIFLTIFFILTHTFGLDLKFRMGKKKHCKRTQILLRFQSFRGSSWTVRQNIFKWVNSKVDSSSWICF